jgi:hypothetical protein
MITFASFAEFAAYLEGLIPAVETAKREGLEIGSELIQAEAKREIGHYQEAVGPFGEWPSLTDATLQGFELITGRYIPGKEELGYSPPDNPLLRDGQLRDNIERTVEGVKEAAVGVPSKTVTIEGDDRPVDIGQVAVWQELGHGGPYPGPPRSFLGGAAVRETDKVVEEIAIRIVNALASKPKPRSVVPQ